MIIGIIIVVVFVVILLWGISVYNGLITARNKKDEAFASIDVFLKRRADLIPNTVEVVKGYAKHEKETLESVIKARNTYVTANTQEDKIKASGELSNALSKLFALSESYPDLKANTNFLELQRTLEDTENKIANSRDLYNTQVLNYNNKIEMFPSNIIAGMFNFTKGTFFETSEEDKKVPTIKF